MWIVGNESPLNRRSEQPNKVLQRTGRHPGAEHKAVGHVTDGDGAKNWHPTEVVEHYLAGVRDFRGVTIEDADGTTAPSFQGMKLAGANFSGSWIDGVDFTGAILTDASFAAAHVKLGTFDGADLQNADFSGAAIDATTFEKADPRGATFDGTSAYGYVYKPGQRP